MIRQPWACNPHWQESNAPEEGLPLQMGLTLPSVPQSLLLPAVCSTWSQESVAFLTPGPLHSWQPPKGF